MIYCFRILDVLKSGQRVPIFFISGLSTVSIEPAHSAASKAIFNQNEIMYVKSNDDTKSIQKVEAANTSSTAIANSSVLSTADLSRSGKGKSFRKKTIKRN